MINFIEGTVADLSENTIVVNCGGMGFGILASSYTLSKVGKIGDKIKIFTHLAVKEDSMTLLGFYSSEEKAMFLRLVGISGIGPKLALSVLSGVPLDRLTAAIVGQNASLLSKIKGVGKKTAERIVLELKDKIKSEFIGIDDVELSNSGSDALLALVSMGFSRAEAGDALSRIQTAGLTTEEIIIKALKKD